MAVFYIFWISAAAIVYTYLGYTLVLFFIHIIKTLLCSKKVTGQPADYPSVALVIVAYNEEEIIEQKIQNSLAVDYPKDKLSIICVTDGSNDSTNDIIRKHKEVTLYFDPERKGKTAAMNRVMPFIKDEITIFTDANTMIAIESVKEFVKCFRNEKTGCVAGEKKINLDTKEKAVASGEGFYWKYESFIKHLESSVNSVVGAAGELFAIRTKLFEPLNENTILDDFELSLRIALKGYKIKYASKAYASENSSLNIREEMKRKVRIAAGSFQTLTRLLNLLNPLKSGFLSFQFFSHKLLRWVFVPLFFILAFVSNALIYFNSYEVFYTVTFYLQVLFYLLVLTGALLQNYSFNFRIIFLPYYLVMMNYSILSGLVRFISNKQDAKWEKAKRKE